MTGGAFPLLWSSRLLQEQVTKEVQAAAAKLVSIVGY